MVVLSGAVKPDGADRKAQHVALPNLLKVRGLTWKGKIGGK
ncbi:hypothetical protein Pint_04807 [Pistacia integerrima]|uniref:Uncharacterized protein n=1 Tax=Pistacia integerrima TaxID=434235 RepID=A0ACC0Z3X7_9ROSI|nr:hypothetical protein Pint_04807 [Pistacia integerrima]